MSPRRDHRDDGCLFWLVAAVLVALAACSPVDVPIPTEPARTVSVPTPTMRGSTP